MEAEKRDPGLYDQEFDVTNALFHGVQLIKRLKSFEIGKHSHKLKTASL